MSYSLRDLPLPVKVVVSVFLMAVGVGYTSAMLQLHMQDSKSGTATPSVADVIKKYTGKKKFDPNDPAQRPVSRLEALITAEPPAISGASMAAAFTTEDRARGPLKFANATRGRLPEVVEQVKAERKGEQTVYRQWINTPDEGRRKAYEEDRFTPAGGLPKAFTPALADGGAAKIRSLVEARCATCHSKGGEKEDVPLDTYDALAKFMTVEAAPAGEWVKVEEPISLTKLTQSTHAHLLSFSVLFSLTGLVFAFSSYPVWARCVLGPWVVLAVFADVSLWWLARLCDQWGPTFAMGIIGTGAVAGLGLGLQITLSLLNMYGTKGKAVILALYLLGGAIAGLVVVNKIVPGLQVKEEAARRQADQPKADDNGHGHKNGTEPPKLDDSQKKELQEALADLQGGDPGKKQAAVAKFDKLCGEAKRKEVEQWLKDAQSPNREASEAAQQKLDAFRKTTLGIVVAVNPPTPASWAERLLEFPAKGPDGKVLSMEETPFTGGEDGNMARAFFDKEMVYRNVKNNDPKEKVDALHALRDGERKALIAWVRAQDGARKAAFDTDRFDLPADLAGKPISPEYVKDGKVRVKQLITDRCLRCHGEGGKQYEEFPLDTYDKWKKYFAPLGAAPPKDK